MSINHYQVLGIPENADEKTINKAYRALALKHHPDKGGDAEQFCKITEAYGVLTDPIQKRLFDSSLPRASIFLRPAAPAARPDEPEDTFCLPREMFTHSSYAEAVAF